jgi:hypothetical protein
MRNGVKRRARESESRTRSNGGCERSGQREEKKSGERERKEIMCVVAGKQEFFAG